MATPSVPAFPGYSPKAFEIDWNDLDVPAPVAPQTTQAPVVAPQVRNDNFGAPVVSSVVAALANAESAVLADTGNIGSSEQLFETGTILAGIGHDNLESDDSEYKALPTPERAIQGFKAAVHAEARQDTIVDLINYRLNSAGRLSHRDLIAGTDGLRVEDVAWRQIAAGVETQNLNAGLSSRTRMPRRVRSRDIGGKHRSAFAVVSSDETRGYKVCDGPEVADLALAGLRDAGMADGARCDLKYDAESTRYQIRMVLQAPIDIMAHRGVGRVHQLFADISGGDNGMHSQRGSMGAIRIRCMNASKSQATGTQWHRQHRGASAEDVRKLIADMVAKFGEVATSLRDVWARASAEYYLDSDGGRLSPQEAITRLVGNKLIPLGGLEADKAVDAYMAAWRAEDSPESAAGIIMAIQRAAHETPWATSWATSDIEESASKHLYQPVYQLPEARS